MPRYHKAFGSLVYQGFESGRLAPSTFKLTGYRNPEMGHYCFDHRIITMQPSEDVGHNPWKPVHRLCKPIDSLGRAPISNFASAHSGLSSSLAT
jgi:hypothetical protein